jgi:hypothetical protein
MLNIISPRIHNLGDFAHCLPALSGLYKLTGQKMMFGVCDRLERFKGIKELLKAQEMFSDVLFMHEIKSLPDYMVIDDSGPENDYGLSAGVVHKYGNFLKGNYKIDFVIDDDFELQVPEMAVEDVRDKILVGDRWSTKDAPDVDDRRLSNLIEGSGILDGLPTHYLDYTKDLVYNCNLIKYNNRPLVTTFTGIAIMADLMKKRTIVVYDDDMINWNNKPIMATFDAHFYKDRKASVSYIKALDTSRL